MPIWQRFTETAPITTVGNSTEIELLHNQVSDDVHLSGNLVIVDGIITVVSDTDDLFGLRLLIEDESVVAADLTEDSPEAHSPHVYYSWFCCRGPLIFRLRSKKTIPPEHKLWFQAWKAQGGNASNLHFGAHLYIHYMH